MESCFPHLEMLSAVPPIPPDGASEALHPKDHEILHDLGEFCKNRNVSMNFQAYIIEGGGGNYGFA